MVEYRLQGAQNAQVIHFHILPIFLEKHGKFYIILAFIKLEINIKKVCRKGVSKCYAIVFQVLVLFFYYES